MLTATAAAYAVRLVVEDKRNGAYWVAVTENADTIVDAARWRDETRRWCARNPLPSGLEYFVRLPRRITD